MIIFIPLVLCFILVVHSSAWNKDSLHSGILQSFSVIYNACVLESPCSQTSSNVSTKFVR